MNRKPARDLEENLNNNMDVQLKKESLRAKGESAEDAFVRLCEIVEILRKECPWDREQTHASIKKGMIEEAYEVCEAIDREDFKNLREELGDVLLQVVFHSSLAAETDKFSICDVINEECEKMIRRHPHIFSGKSVKTVDKVLEKWENIKRIEHGETNQAEVLRQVPLALPALIRSFKVQKKAADVGFDWPDISGALEKFREETEELHLAINNNNHDEITEELGDLLFSIVNLARFLEVEPEEALVGTIEKFIKRFSYIEERALLQGAKLQELSLDEMDLLWEEAKSK